MQPINENIRKMIKYQGGYIWNKLPDAVTKSPSFPSFEKKIIKKHYLELQRCLGIHTSYIKLTWVLISLKCNTISQSYLPN